MKSIWTGETWSQEEYSVLIQYSFLLFILLCFINLFEKFTIQKHSFYGFLFACFWIHFSHLLYNKLWHCALTIMNICVIHSLKQAHSQHKKSWYWWDYRKNSPVYWKTSCAMCTCWLIESCCSGICYSV